MRLTCLLLMGLILLMASCVPYLPAPEQKENSNDTLAKYSYLITTMDSRYKDTSVATGFFIRKRDTLWLVSAYHVFTNWDLYKRKYASDVRPAFLDVWYRNAAGDIKTETFPLPQHPESYYKKLKIQMDFDMIDVSPSFKDGGVYSVEKMDPGIEDLNNLPGDTVLAFGYSHVSKHDLDSVSTGRIPPSTKYISRGQEMARRYRAKHKKEQVGLAYFFASPPLQQGASGAPIFRLKTDSTGVKKIEFVGVQSGSDEDSTRSMMVRIIHVYNQLHAHSK